ncbi:MAG: glycosyltransferase family A protein [Saprospiraceae bacterium]
MEQSRLSLMKSYLDKSALYPPLISNFPNPNLKMILIIPAYHEEEILLTLLSLFEANRIDLSIEIIVVLNYPEKNAEQEKEFHEKQHTKINQWILENRIPKLQIYCPSPVVLKSKHAGVGLVRKIGMDEAVRRFIQIGNSNGIIINIDADCLCDKNYWYSIQAYFSSKEFKPCVGFNFNHRIEDLSPENLKAIIDYELHLRYYIAAQKIIQYPFAYQTLGSCFAIETHAYCAQGGMNKRQAGEDFYFLHKFSVIEQLGEIDEVLVYPSARISERVPFGTGKAVSNYLESGQQLSYTFEAINYFGQVIKMIPRWYEMNTNEILLSIHLIENNLSNYFMTEKIIEEIERCKSNCSDLVSFNKRMLRWLNPFRLMKYLHYMRDHGYPDQEIKTEAIKLLSQSNITLPNMLDSKNLLEYYRQNFQSQNCHLK